jgi:hypothetical protein
METTVTEGADDSTAEARQSGLTPAAGKLLEALRAVAPATNTQLVDWIAENHGHGLKRETVSRSMTTLEKLGLARPDDHARGPFKATVWNLVAENDTASM